MADPDPSEQMVVFDSEGVQGTVAAQALQQTETQVWVTFDQGRRVQVPVAMLRRREDASIYLPLSLRELEEGTVELQSPADSAGHSPTDGTVVAVLPVVVEEAQITKREVETGSVRIHKSVHTSEEEIRVPLVQDRVQVQRVPVDRFLERPAETRYEGDTLVIPVMEEVVVVQKRLLLREEIHVTTVRERVDHQETVRLQREQVNITREDARLDDGDPQ